MGNTVSQVYVHFTFKGRVTDKMAPATLSCGVHFQHQGSLTLCSGHLNLSYHLSFSHSFPIVSPQLQLKSRAPLNRCTQHCHTLRTKRIVFDV